MYEYNYQNTGWRPCDARKALNILATGYFDPTPVLEYVNEGHSVVTTQYEVRRKEAKRQEQTQ